MKNAKCKLGIILEMIKFEHTVFALPFALTSAVVAARGIPDWETLGWIVVAMVGARSAAMAFNRVADLRYDSNNPRTKDRALPKGLVSVGQTWIFIAASVALFVLAAFMLNRLAFYLSPVALAVIFGYSYTKRFTSWSHIVLGISLGIAPVGAWIAVKGTFALPPIILAACVMLWTAGFDVIYSLQDVEFDRRAGLFSLPRMLGEARALLVSRLMHAAMVLFLAWFAVAAGMGTIFYLGLGMVVLFLIYEHSLVSPTNLSRVNTAFFTMNGCVSVAMFVFALADVLL
ncbi:MAG: UbiA family prenyltransferase [Armatimonadetes bacterium]|nr:UbiA family prenyltransferase [Armatimonadota bacterium]